MIVNDSGVIVEVYHKMHLFDVNVQDGPRLKESNAVIPGDKIVPPVPTPVGNVGLAIVSYLRVILWLYYIYITIIIVIILQEDTGHEGTDKHQGT